VTDGVPVPKPLKPSPDAGCDVVTVETGVAGKGLSV
jgi:hypothetical protein